ncbi:hypothetical protein FisN_2Lh021 [Fistulifera solaris]|uniref:Uncharacterized protein n=1 Tax=Fistulifera solaris TaxID=1519565 RepID=A0A1Z5JWI2_FISSO|nr:hypothetical protein FisN_2Lh021 [Fistulifera solaris]|eukprot:GAX18400.1 hypothetical protein FisN_2Lh021 [Fistulifera solaris]
MSTPLRLAVQAGACMRNGGDGFRVCALQPKDCPMDAIFMSARRVDGGLAHGGACTTRRGTEEVTKIGRCADGGCTSDASACQDPSQFVAVDDRCTILADGTRNGAATLFGKCEADASCYWSRVDCASSWIPAYAENNMECTCDQVRVGACFDNGFYYCAVAAEACDEEAEWIDAVTLQTQADAPSCFLCRGEDGTPFGNVNASSPAPTLAPIAVSQPSPIVTTPRIEAKEKGSNEQALILGATLGNLFVLILLSGAALYLRRGSQQKSIIAGKAASDDLPSESVTVTQIHVDYHEDEYVSDMDVA